MFSAPFKLAADRRRGINSVEIGISVLQAVVDLGGPSSLKDIAARSGLAASQTHRYVSALVNCGMLKQSASGHYDLGYTSLRTGFAGAARLPSLVAAYECAEQFTESTGATSLVAVWSVQGPTIIRWNVGRPPLYTVLTIGSVLPVMHSATGAIFLAFGPPAMIEPVIKREGVRTPLSKNPELQIKREATRRAWLSSVDGTAVPGLRAYACPILASDESLVAVVAAVAAETSPREHDKQFKQQLRQICAATSRSLGSRSAPED